MINNFSFERTVDLGTSAPIVKTSFDINLELLQDVSVQMNKDDFAKELGKDILSQLEAFLRSTKNVVSVPEQNS